MTMVYVTHKFLKESLQENIALRRLVSDMRGFIDPECDERLNQAGYVSCRAHDKDLPCEWPKVREQLKALGFS